MISSHRPTNNLTVLLIVSIAVSILSNSHCNAFTFPTQNFAISHKTRYTSTTSTSSSLLRSSVSSNTNKQKKKNVIVISPPGGIGEITSLNTAKLGGNVKWFVVRAPQSNFKGNTARTSTNDGQIALTTETLNVIEKAGGSIDFAGASADTLIQSLNEEDGLVLSNIALSSLASWLSSSSNDSSGGANSGEEYSIICTYDGALDEKKRVQQYKSPEELEMNLDEEKLIKNGIRLAARQALSTVKSGGGSGCEKIALLSANEEELVSNTQDEEEESGGGLLGNLFGGNKKGNIIPSSLGDALDGLSSIVRYGELFGAPESSPESSPFMGGPKRDPTVREMYTLRSVRLDPSGNMGDTSKSNRLAVGEIASQLGLGMVDSIANNKSNGNMRMDVSLSSFAGTDTPTNEEWNAEFERVLSNMKKSGGAQLFSAEFSSVPSTTRLAEWIATKWAPAILRSYDIAGTRVGARPVFALQTGGDETTVEIVWQELVDFKSVTSGKMIINVNDDGISASRGAGNASDGYGRVSSSPLPGEEILIRRLADAASQAVEKGLAVKPQLSKKAEKKAAAVKKEPVAAAVASVPPTQPAAPTSDGPGPRSSGARRSSERSRGRRKSSPPSADGGEP